MDFLLNWDETNQEIVDTSIDMCRLRQKSLRLHFFLQKVIENVTPLINFNFTCPFKKGKVVVAEIRPILEEKFMSFPSLGGASPKMNKKVNINIKAKLKIRNVYQVGCTIKASYGF